MFISFELFLDVLQKRSATHAKELMLTCKKVIDSWDQDIHDTNEVSSEVLKVLGNKWITDIECIFSDMTQYENNSLDYLFVTKFPPPGRDRTRLLKYSINYLLNSIYGKDDNFKCFNKYNSKNSLYKKWKRVKGKPRQIQNVNKEEPGYISLTELKSFIEKRINNITVEYIRERKCDENDYYTVWNLEKTGKNKFLFSVDEKTFKYSNYEIAEYLVDYLLNDDVKKYEVAKKELEEFKNRYGKYRDIVFDEALDNIKELCSKFNFRQIKAVEALTRLLSENNSIEYATSIANKLGFTWSDTINDFDR